MIYFIIGGRGRYNPRLGNEAIHEECGGRPGALFSLGLSSRRPPARTSGNSIEARTPPLYGSRRLARAFTAANRNYSSRKNARIREAETRAAPGPSFPFGKRALSGIASRSRQLFLSLALKRSNCFWRLFRAPESAQLLLFSTTFHRGRCARLLVYKTPPSFSAVSICENSIDVLPFTATSNFRVSLTMREETSCVVEIN